MATGLPSLLQTFVTDRLLRQQRASPNTVAGYRDSFRLLFHFAKERLSKAPSNLTIEDLNASFIGDFLDDLENRRKNSARTRNIRLAAIHSFFQYVAFEEPAHALLCQRILAMPAKRHEHRPIEFLNREEIDALLGAANLSTWIGRRDRTLLLLTVQTGLRVSELINLTCQDVVLNGDSAHAAARGCHGPPSSRRGSHCDCSLARPRIDRDDPDLSTCRYATQGTRTCPRHLVRTHARPLPAAGPTTRLLGEPVVMPTNRTPKIREPSQRV